MSWNKDKKDVWMVIAFILLYILLHGVLEVGYLRGQLEKHDAEVKDLDQRYEMLNNTVDKLLTHTHVYHDGSVLLKEKPKE